MRNPVLLIVFSRPETTRPVFEAIRRAKPPRLYVAADAPRPDKEGEAERCAEVRRITTAVDWPCELRTRFPAENQGNKYGPARAIDWFFQHEEQGLIFEDDILPQPTFFPYCDELLERYRDDERIGLIGGENPISNRYSPRNSYFFARHIRMWGWATWRRAWRHYDVEMAGWPEWRDGGGMRVVSRGQPSFEAFWRRVLDSVFSGRVPIWDVPWVFACWRLGLLAAYPAQNQIENLGYGPTATYTHNVPDWVKHAIPEPLAFPLRHPPTVAPDRRADAIINRRVYGLSFKRDLKRLIRTTPYLGDFLKSLQMEYRRRRGR